MSKDPKFARIMAAVRELEDAVADVVVERLADALGKEIGEAKRFSHFCPDGGRALCGQVVHELPRCPECERLLEENGDPNEAGLDVLCPHQRDVRQFCPQCYDARILAEAQSAGEAHAMQQRAEGEAKAQLCPGCGKSPEHPLHRSLCLSEHRPTEPLPASPTACLHGVHILNHCPECQAKWDRDHRDGPDYASLQALAQTAPTTPAKPDPFYTDSTELRT